MMPNAMLVRIRNLRPSDRASGIRGCQLVSLIAVSLLMTSVATAQNNAPPNPDEDRIAVMAVVNGTRFTRDQLAQECLARYGQEVLERMIKRQLVLGGAQRFNINITDEEVWKEIEKTANKWGMSTEHWLTMLAERREVTQEEYFEFVWTTLMLRRMAEGSISVTAQEVDQILESETGPKVQARMIVCATQQKAETVLAMIQEDPNAFGKIARQHSDDPNTAANSGMLTQPIRRHMGSPQLEEVAFSLQEGEVSDIFQIGEQFYIIRCEALLPAEPITPQQEQIARQRIVDHLNDKKLAEASDRIFQTLQEQTEIVNVYNSRELSQQYPGVAALVGNRQITVRDLSEECITRHGAGVLEGEINRILLQLEIERRGVQLTEQHLQAEIARAADAFGMLNDQGEADVEAWLQYITEEDGVTVDLYVRDAVWPSVALKLLVEDQIDVTEEDLDKAFEANFGERVEALAIVLPDQRTAQKVWQLAKANPTPQFFGELAHQYSTEPSSQANYGKVPPIGRYGGRKKLEDEAFLLEPGELSGLIEVGEHWIVLMCLGRTDPIVTDRTDPKVRQQLYDDIYEKKLRMAMSERFNEIKSSASIDNFLLGTTQSPQTLRAAQVPNDDRGRVPFKVGQPSNGGQSGFGGQPNGVR